MKAITAWLICRPGTRDQFLAEMVPFVAATRAEPGCRLFEYHRADRHPDEVILLEIFDSAEAHEFHRRTEHQFAMQAILRRLLGPIRVVEVISEDVREYELDFVANPPGPYVP